MPAWYVRLIAAAAMVGALAVLCVAVWLQPDTRGFGTHEQLLGQGPCGFLTVTGYPCPTCGMTTSFAHTVRFQWRQAIWAQPGGFVLALGTVATVLLAAYAVLFGRLPKWFHRYVTPYRLFWAVLIAMLGGWAFKLIIGRAMGVFPS